MNANLKLSDSYLDLLEQLYENPIWKNVHTRYFKTLQKKQLVTNSFQELPSGISAMAWTLTSKGKKYVESFLHGDLNLSKEEREVFSMYITHTELKISKVPYPEALNGLVEKGLVYIVGGFGNARYLMTSEGKVYWDRFFNKDKIPGSIQKIVLEQEQDRDTLVVYMDWPTLNPNTKSFLNIPTEKDQGKLYCQEIFGRDPDDIVRIA